MANKVKLQLAAIGRAYRAFDRTTAYMRRLAGREYDEAACRAAWEHFNDVVEQYYSVRLSSPFTHW